MFLIAEIHAVAPHLLRLIGGGEILRQLHQRQHGRGHGLQILPLLALADRQQRTDLIQLVLAPLAYRLRLLLGPVAALDDAHPPEGGLQPGHGVPALLRRRLIAPQLLRHLQKPVAIAPVQIRILLHPRRRLRQLLRPEPSPPQDAVRQYLPVRPHGLRHLLPLLPQPLQPPHGVGVALDLPVDVQHQPLQRPVIPPGTQRLRQLLGLGIPPADALVKLLQYLLQHLHPQQLRLLLIQHPEIRGQAPLPLRWQQVDILPQQAPAKGIHRFDVRLIHPHHLAAQVHILRLTGHSLAQLCGDPAPQLRRRRFGEGDDEEIVDAAALPLHIAEQPLHQHLGLAGTGGGGHQQAAAPVLHGPPLLRRGLKAPHDVPPLPSHALQIPRIRRASPASAAAAGRRPARPGSDRPMQNRSRCRHSPAAPASRGRHRCSPAAAHG